MVTFLRHVERPPLSMLLNVEGEHHWPSCASSRHLRHLWRFWQDHLLGAEDGPAGKTQYRISKNNGNNGNNGNNRWFLFFKNNGNNNDNMQYSNIYIY